MDVRQQGLQLRKVIREAAWPRGSQDVVVGDSAYLTPTVSGEDLPARSALALLNIGAGSPDEEEPRLVNQEFRLLLAQIVQGDLLRESAIEGSGRTQGVGSSEGRSVIEMEVPVLAAVRSLTGADGLNMLVSHGTSVEVAPLEAEEEVVGREYVIRTVCTTDPSWPPAQDFILLEGSPITLNWRRHRGRYDYKDIVLVRKVGAIGPVDYTDGIEVLRGDFFNASDAPAAGTYTYGIFVRYSERDGVDDTVYSVPLYRTVTVV